MITTTPLKPLHLWSRNLVGSDAGPDIAGSHFALVFTVISLLNFAYNLLIENLPSKKEGYKILYEVKMGYLVISILNLTEVYDYLPHTSKKFQEPYLCVF